MRRWPSRKGVRASPRSSRASPRPSRSTPPPRSPTSPGAGSPLRCMRGWRASSATSTATCCARLRRSRSSRRASSHSSASRRRRPIIRSSYWTAAGNGDGGGEPDRRGLTGSARLLRDLTELDQHAFETNRRKLNLEHVFSLSRTAPDAFAEFRRTGVLSFATPVEAFDRRFPGTCCAPSVASASRSSR